MKHSCRPPLPIPALGTYWSCPDCGDGWYVTDKGWISGRHWERASDEVEENIGQILAWLDKQDIKMYPWQVRILRMAAYQELGGNPNRGDDQG